MSAVLCHVAEPRRRNVTGMRKLLDLAIEDMHAEGITRFTSSTLVARAARHLPPNGHGPSEIARLAKAVENMVTNGQLVAVDTERVPGIKRPVTVYEAVEQCPLMGADLQASFLGWMQPGV